MTKRVPEGTVTQMPGGIYRVSRPGKPDVFVNGNGTILRSQIASCTMPPGVKIDLDAWAASKGVTRSSAILQFVMDGLYRLPELDIRRACPVCGTAAGTECGCAHTDQADS